MKRSTILGCAVVVLLMATNVALFVFRPKPKEPTQRIYRNNLDGYEIMIPRGYQVGRYGDEIRIHDKWGYIPRARLAISRVNTPLADIRLDLLADHDEEILQLGENFGFRYLDSGEYGMTLETTYFTHNNSTYKVEKNINPAYKDIREQILEKLRFLEPERDPWVPYSNSWFGYTLQIKKSMERQSCGGNPILPQGIRFLYTNNGLKENGINIYVEPGILQKYHKEEDKIINLSGEEFWRKRLLPATYYLYGEQSNAIYTISTAHYHIPEIAIAFETFHLNPIPRPEDPYAEIVEYAFIHEGDRTVLYALYSDGRVRKPGFVADNLLVQDENGERYIQPMFLPPNKNQFIIYTSWELVNGQTQTNIYMAHIFGKASRLLARPERGMINPGSIQWQPSDERFIQYTELCEEETTTYEYHYRINTETEEKEFFSAQSYPKLE